MGTLYLAEKWTVTGLPAGLIMLAIVGFFIFIGVMIGRRRRRG